jgi:hypothetical protein
MKYKLNDKVYFWNKWNQKFVEYTVVEVNNKEQSYCLEDKNGEVIVENVDEFESKLDLEKFVTRDGVVFSEEILCDTWFDNSKDAYKWLYLRKLRDIQIEEVKLERKKWRLEKMSEKFLEKFVC